MFSDLHFSCSAGVPHFIQEPQDVSVFPNVPFNLTCAAVGPPGPVEVLWWFSGAQVGEPRPSPSVLLVQGQNPQHGNYISYSRQCSHWHTDAVCKNVLDTHTGHTLLRCTGGRWCQCLGGSTASSWRCVSELSSSEL